MLIGRILCYKYSVSPSFEKFGYSYVLKNLLFVWTGFLLIQFLTVFSAKGAVKDDSAHYLYELNQAISLRDEYAVNKEMVITILKDSLRRAFVPLEKFRFQKAVFEQYIDYQLDSALVYSLQMMDLTGGRLQKEPVFKAEAMLFIARVYARTGKYTECAKFLGSDIFQKSKLPNAIKELYFAVQLELNRGLFDHIFIKSEREELHSKVKSSLDSLLTYTPQNSVWYPIHLSNKLRADGDYDKALKILLDRYNSLRADDRQMAHVAYFISNLYRIKGDEKLEKHFLILSSIIDVKYSVREYVSLWKLATLLYQEGDIETAHHYIEISLDDAMYSGAYRWTLQIQHVLPKIYQAYNAKIIQQRDKITMGAFIIGGLLTVMIALVFFVMWQNKKLVKAKKVLNTANEELCESNRQLNSVSNELQVSNAELQLLNSQLLFLNRELVEMNVVKEAYLSKFIDLCSDYIEKLDVYRLNLSRLMKSKKHDQVMSELQSTKYVDDEIKLFLANFDETFLRIYPNFVQEFNSLFPQEEWQILKKNELLNTELRVFALIRLGISDSSKIAKFLRCSITTVYTYRSKTRNKSLCPNEFEERITGSSHEDSLFSMI